MSAIDWTAIAAIVAAICGLLNNFMSFQLQKRQKEHNAIAAQVATNVELVTQVQHKETLNAIAANKDTLDAIVASPTVNGVPTHG